MTHYVENIKVIHLLRDIFLATGEGDYLDKAIESAEELIAEIPPADTLLVLQSLLFSLSEIKSSGAPFEHIQLDTQQVDDAALGSSANATVS